MKWEWGAFFHNIKDKQDRLGLYPHGADIVIERTNKQTRWQQVCDREKVAGVVVWFYWEGRGSHF